MNPNDAIVATTHQDPYPFYETLAAQEGLRFDPQLGLWIATSAAAITAVLGHPNCRVRPLAEPIPAAIVGATAGQIFGDLVRMNDGAKHTQPKLAFQRALGGVDPAHARAQARELAHSCWRDDGLARWIFEVPVSTMARLIGFTDDQLPTLAAWMEDFVACLSPLSSATQIANAHLAARALLDSFKALLRDERPGSLLARVRTEADAVGWDNADALLANLVGLLSQTYEATAGLIGNAIIALLRQPADEDSDVTDAAALVRAVSRYDPSVHNTRRFMARDAMICGAQVHAGQAILLVLAAANRDPAGDGRGFGFGHGLHACPGHALACEIATGALEVLLTMTPQWRRQLAWTYRPSLNARVPIFTQAQEAA
jgi:cytochrome P450